MAEPALLAGAEPFEFPGGGDLGVLLVHGFTGTPSEMRPIARALATHGIGSIGIRLRGHGIHPEAMLACRAADWVEDVEQGLDRLLDTYGRAVVVGLSMGGTLGLNLAARRAGDPRLAGVVSICAPLVLNDWRLRFLPILGRLIKWQAWGRPDIKDASAWGRHVGYRRLRARTIGELLALAADTRTRLRSIHQPILIVQAREDHVVPPMNADLIEQGVSSVDREVIMLDDCYHVVTLDFAADRLNDEVVRFVQRLIRAGATAPVASAGGSG